jgi:D-aspartate ligase
MHRENKKAVLLGLADTGYGIVRSLAKQNISVISLGWEANKKIYPELKTRYSDCRIVNNNEQLLKTLLELPNEIGYKPSLFISSDEMVSFFSQHKKELSEIYLIDFPEEETVNLLLKKNLFSEFALKNNFLIPKTFIIKSKADVYECIDSIDMPCVIKPYLRADKWGNAHFPKVFYFDTKKKLGNIIENILMVESDLLIQEWIPGYDDSIYFCLVYFNEFSNCIASFTGRKLRQWPVGTGSTACAEPFENSHILDETLRLFNGLSYKGFGSLEFKRHSNNGEYYIMEPTVGRQNHQSYLATANGINISVTAYNSLNQINLPQIVSKPPFTIWIDDPIDIISIFINIFRGQLNYGRFFRSIFYKKSFRYLNFRDPFPLIYLWLVTIPYKIFNKIKKIISHKVR